MRALVAVVLLLTATHAHAVDTATGSSSATVREPVFGGNLYLEEHGREHAQTVVFVHGIGDNGVRDWDSVWPAVSARFHTVAFDWPGFGRSTKSNAEYAPPSYARVLEWVVDKYAHGPVIVVGHSMGAAVALYFAAQKPAAVRKLILFNTAGVLHRTTLLKFLASSAASPETSNPVSARVGSWFERLIERGERLAQKYADSVDESQLRKMVIEDTPASVAGAGLMETDFSALVTKVTAPVTLVWGERDRIAPLRTGQVLAAWLSRAELITIPDAAHVPMNETPTRARELVEASLATEGVVARTVTPDPEIPADAKLRCNNENGQTYTGVWSTIEISSCAGVELKDIVTRELVVKGSKVNLLNVRVLGGATGITVERSEFNATNLYVSADVALRTSASRHDLAGIELVGKSHAIANNLPGYVVCSLCSLRSGPVTQSWHGVYELEMAGNR